MPDVSKLSSSSQEETRFWKVFEGQLLDGFPLDGYAGPSQTGATFASRIPGDDKPVLLKVVRYGSLGWERLSASWALAKNLSHAHLVRVYACGLGSLDGLRVAYAVTDYPDAKLTDVLAERCLTENEGRDLLAGCAAALQYLHQKGFVHRQVDAAGIVAVDDAIKLSSDHLTKASERECLTAEADPQGPPELAMQGYGTAADIWYLGSTIVQALTGAAAEKDKNAAPLPASYAAIVEKCFAPRPENRCSARQILTSLQQTPVATAPDDDYEAPRSAGYSSPRSRYAVDVPANPSIFARAKYALPVVSLLLLAGFWLSSSQGSRPAPQAQPALRANQPLPKRGEQGDVDRSSDQVPHASIKPAPAPEPVKAAAPIMPSGEPRATSATGTWSVVVYTYSHPDSAEHKAAEINKKWPRLRARVLEAKDGSSHLVVLGNGMDKASARKLRSEALAARLPRDSYIMTF